MAKIWAHNFWYSFLRPYVDWCGRTSYRSLIVRGKENVPTDTPVIYAPNHSNTLMDAIVMLQCDKDATTFGARADIFKNPTAAKLLRFLRIVPLARQRDGQDALAHNEDIFDEVIDCIGHDVPFCMFVEGTHRTKHSLMQPRKGIFRISTRGAAKLGKPVSIIPVGIDYSDYFHYMGKCVVTFGHPIQVDENSNFLELKDTLYQKMSELITFFPDDENYDKAWAEYERTHVAKRQWWHYLLALLSIPFFLFVGALSLPMWVAALLLGRKIKDKAWLNTIRFATKFALLPILTILWAVLGFIFLPWYLVIIGFPVLWYSQSVFYALLSFYRFVLWIK